MKPAHLLRANANRTTAAEPSHFRRHLGVGAGVLTTTVQPAYDGGRGEA